MTKEQLKELGLDDEKADKVLELHNNAIKDSFVPLARFNEVNSAKKNAEETVKTMTKQLDELKKVDAEGMKQQIEALQQQNKEAAEKYAADLEAMRKSNAIDAALASAKAKNIRAVKALIAADELVFEGDVLKGLDEQIKKLKDADDTKFLFDADEPAKPTFTGIKPSGGGTGVAEEGRGAIFAQKYNSKMGVNANKE